MRRRHLITLLSIACLAVLSGSVVLAGVRLSKSRAIAVRSDAAAGLHDLGSPEGGNPFGIHLGGADAPALPTLAPLPVPNSPALTDPFTAVPGEFERATQVPGDRASYAWALIIGINKYYGGTRNNIGSFQDAQTLHDYLISLGWRADHVLLIGDHAATRSGIVAGLQWLESHTDADSTAIFSYSGHEMPQGHGAARHIMLWAADNELLQDTDLAAHIGAVRAKRMWVNMAVCRADGFNKPGMSMPGRVLTFSSPASELSYEDPNVHHSVFGYNLLVQGIIHHRAAPAGRSVSVEEAFRYSIPYVISRTLDNQHPVMVDRYPGGHFTLDLP